MASLYMIDANTLLEAANRYYAFGTVDSFWSWMSEQTRQGVIRSASLMQEEIEWPDELVTWVKEQATLGLFVDESQPEVQNELKKIASWVVAQRGFAPEQKAKFLKGADPWIIAAAKVHGAKVVTQEVLVDGSSQKIKIPNVCRQFDVECLDTFTLLKELDASL